MTETRKRLLDIEGSIWKDTGELATYKEVMAANAAIYALLPELTIKEEQEEAKDLLYTLARYEWKVVPAKIREEKIREAQRQSREDDEKRRRGEIEW